MSQPLILTLIVKLLELIGYICAFICLPITLYCKLVIAICDKREEIKDSRPLHFWMFLPRLLLVLPFFPWSFFGLSALYGWAVSLAIPNHPRYMPYVLALVALVINSIGWVFTRFKFESLKEFKFGSYFKSAGESIIDLGAFLSLILSIVTVIRIPFLFMMFSRHSKTIRKQLYLNMLLIIPDMLCVPILLLECVFVWRIINVGIKAKEQTKGSYAFSFRKRGIVLLEGLKILWDLFVILLFPFMILVPYRLVMAIRKIRRSTTGRHRRIDEAMFYFMIHGLGAIVDFFLITFFIVIVGGTLYRLIPAYKRITRDPLDSFNQRRLLAFLQICYVFVDLAVLFSSVFLILSVYRLPNVWERMSRKGFHRYQSIILKQFLQFLIDLPFIFMGTFVTVLMWRAFFLWRDIAQVDKAWERRDAALHHFGWLFLDIIDTPFVLASLLILGTGWRAYFFVKGFPSFKSHNSGRAAQRKYVFKQFIALILDIPTFIGFLLLMVTVYRAPTTLKQLKLYFIAKNKSLDHKEIAKGNIGSGHVVDIHTNNQVVISPVHSELDEDNPVPVTNQVSSNVDGKDYAKVLEGMSSWRMIVGKQFFLLLIDIPFPILLLLTMWRLPILIQRLREIDDPERKYAQRRLLILRYLWYVLLDILCIVPTLLICLLVWRVPSFVAMIKNYRRGDSEHKLVGVLFLKLLADIPFVLLGAVTFIFPWRGIFLVVSVYKDCKSDKSARIMVLKYLGMMAVDIIIFIILSIILVTLWRIPTFVVMLKYFLTNENGGKWHHTRALFKSCYLSLVLIGMDILFVIQSLFILIVMMEIKPFIQEFKKLKEGDENFTIGDCRQLVAFFFLESLRDVPHIVLLPLKFVGLLFWPIHYYLGKRNKSKVTQSFLKVLLYWIHDLSTSCMSFLEFDKFATVNLIGAIIIIPNELGCVVVAFNSIYMFIVTMGSPLWNKFRLKYGWDELGNAVGPMVILEYITVILQTILFPVFVAIQLLFLILPIILGLAFYNDERLGSNEYWKLFFSDRDFWRDNIPKFSAGVWVAQGFWVLVMAVAWHINFLVARKYFPLFSPIKSMYWLVKKVFVGRFWKLYKYLLAGPTYACYRLKIIGEVLMFPLFITWTCWPLIIPIVTKIYYIFIPSGLLTAFLIFKSYFIIRDSWGEPVPINNTPLVKLSGVFIRVPEDGGIIITFRGSMPYGFPIEDVRLSLEGDAIWKAIEKAIGKTKIRAALMLVGYPITLCPMFLNIETINNCPNPQLLEFSLNIGTPGGSMLLKKKVLVKVLNQIIAIDNPTFDFTIEYGRKDFGWKKLGVLCRFNTSLSILLEAGNDNNGNHSLPGYDGVQNEFIPIAPPLPDQGEKQPNHRHKGPAFLPVQPPPPPEQPLNSSFDADLALALELSRIEEEARQNRMKQIQEEQEEEKEQELEENDNSKFKSLKSSVENNNQQEEGDEGKDNKNSSNSDSSSSSSRSEHFDDNYAGYE